MKRFISTLTFLTLLSSLLASTAFACHNTSSGYLKPGQTIDLYVSDCCGATNANLIYVAFKGEGKAGYGGVHGQGCGKHPQYLSVPANGVSKYSQGTTTCDGFPIFGTKVEVTAIGAPMEYGASCVCNPDVGICSSSSQDLAIALRVISELLGE
ncbi:MAG: hypothetical protein P1U40_01820 [Coxiellaceae bacterium]|nr:hypothetical protein [Coxiellaceae bacterium]